MKKIIQLLAVILSTQVLSGCFAALAGGALGAMAQGVASAKQSESKPPKYIDISRQGRIITASFKATGFSGLMSHNKGAQIRGFQEWATAVVVREAPKQNCINIINVFSAGAGAKVSGSRVSNKIQFRCLEKETMMSEQDLLSDKQVIYAEQIKYIDEHPEIVRYVEVSK